MAGVMFACHGLDKIFGTFGGKVATAPMMVTGGWLELVLGFLIAFGLLTRIAALLASGQMAVAFFMFHAKGANLVPIVNKGELAALYCFVFLFMFFYGPGQWAIDAMMKRGAPASPTPTP